MTHSAVSQSPPSNPQSTAATHLRSDLVVIAELIPRQTRVLDLGCGDGALLQYLVEQKQVKGRGIELDEQNILTCVRRGLSVRQGNLEEGLADYPDRSFDYVVLSQTLHFLDHPARILRDMLRVGEYAVVSFPNWGYWRCRLELLLYGRIPKARNVFEDWYETPRWQAFTVTDFSNFCRTHGFKIEQQVYLTGRGKRIQTKYKNLLSATAVFTLRRA
ncbi:MAG: methionine biosynthesis protein MetW [Caldilineaceae bacterium]